MTDRFPEAFRRFEEDVDVSRFESFRQLEFAFGRWAGQKWIPTYRQLDALRYEARRIGTLRDGFRRRNTIYFPYLPNISWRHETVTLEAEYNIDTETAKQDVSSRNHEALSLRDGANSMGMMSPSQP